MEATPFLLYVQAQLALQVAAAEQTDYSGSGLLFTK